MRKLKGFKSFVNESGPQMTLEQALSKIENLYEKIDDLEAEKSDLESELEDIKSEKIDLERDLEKKTEEFERLESQSDDMVNLISSLEKEKKELEEKVDMLSDKNEELSDLLSTYEDWREFIKKGEGQSEIWGFVERLEDMLKVFKENPVEIGAYLKEKDRDPIIDYVINKEILDAITGKGGDLLRRYI